MTQSNRWPDPLEAGVRPERVNVAAADAAGGYPERHLSGSRPDERDVLDAGFSRPVAGFHESFHLHTSTASSLSGVRVFKDILDGGLVTVTTQSGHNGIHRRRDHRVPPPGLPGMNVGEMGLHLEHVLDRLEGVVDGVGIVGPGAGVDSNPMTPPCFPDEANHLSLVVRLPELELHQGELLAQLLLYIAEGQGAVDLWPARPQGAEVHAVEHEHPSQRTPPRNLVTSCRSSHTGREVTEAKPLLPPPPLTRPSALL